MTAWQQMTTADVLTLGMAADEARRAQPGGAVVTYVRVHAVSPAEFQTPIAVPDAASEVRLYETPETLEEAIDQIRTLRPIAGTRRLAAFSMAEIERRGWSNDVEALARLVDAGMDDVAELPVDELTDVSLTLGLLHKAGVRPQRLTIRYPTGQRRTEIISSVQRAVEGAATSVRFAPLPRVAPIDKPTTGYDDLRSVALARLALPHVSIEVDWTLYGPKLAQVALTFGADHLDAVSAIDDPSIGRRRAAVEDVERNIKAAGFTPREHRAERRIDG